MTSGVDPSGYVAEREIGQHVLTRIGPPVLDVRGEQHVEPAERVLAGVAVGAGADLTGAATHAEAAAKARVVLLGHAEQVGHREHGERLRVRAR